MKKILSVLLVLLVGLVLVLSTDGSKRNAVGQAKREPIKIGCLVERTGGVSLYGYSHEKVMRVAVAKVNKEGGILGRPVELYVEDTESKPSVGGIKFRKLVETYGASFVFNSTVSGIALACVPIAKELKTPYFAVASATEISGENSNRYVFQISTNVRQECKAVAKFALNKIGRKWITIVNNAAWGWSSEDDFKKYITESGGMVLNSIRVPLGTGDWLPYLKGKIPDDAEGVYNAIFASEFFAFIRDLHAVRPNIKKLGGVYVLSGAMDTKKLGAEGEGFYCTTAYPTRLEGLNTKFNKAYRELIGIDVYGKEIGTGTYYATAKDWAVWESFFALKAAIEKSGWKGNEDTPKVIKTLEGMAFKESLEFPQGDMYIRAEDHLNITRLFIEQVIKGDLKVAARISAEDGVYPPLVDHTKEPF